MAKKSKVTHVSIRTGTAGTHVTFIRDRLNDCGLIEHTIEEHEVRDTWNASTKMLEDLVKSSYYDTDVLIGEGWMNVTIYSPRDNMLMLDSTNE